MAEVLSELVARITTDASGLKSGLASADKSIGSFVAKNQAGLRSLGVAFTAMGAAIVGGLAASTKAAVTFETAFTGVRKTVTATEAEFAVLSNGIRNLAKELPLTHSEIAGIAEAAGQLGIQTDSILGFTEVMAQLGMTTNMAAQDAATALARFANITQMSQKNFSKLGAVIVDLGNNFATTEAEIVDMAMRLAGSGHTIGMSESQIMGLAAALSSVGIKAELGGTAFAKVMLEMNSAVASGGDKIKAWANIANVSVGEFERLFREDAAGAIQGLIAGVGRLQTSGADVTAVLEDMGLGGIRVTDALLRAAGAQDLFTDAQVTANKAWEENTSLTEEARKRLETTAAKLAILKNVLVDVGITIGDFIVPLLKQFVDFIRPVIDKVQEWINENPVLTKLLVILASSLGAILIPLGALMIVLPSVAQGFLFLRTATLASSLAFLKWAAIIAAALIPAAFLAHNLYNIKAILSGRETLTFSEYLGELKDTMMGYAESLVGGIDRTEEFDEEIKKLEKDINKSIETTLELNEGLDPGLVNAQNEAAGAMRDLIDAGNDLDDKFADLMRQLIFNETAAGKLRLRMDDVYTAMYRLGYKTEQINDVFRIYGDVTEVDEALLDSLGITAEEVARLVGKLKDETDKGTEAFKAYGDEAEKSAEKVAASWGATLAEIKATKEGGGKASLTEYIGSKEGTAEVYGRMEEGGISKREAISDMQKEVYGFGLPGYASGGVVPGPIGAPQLATVHGGETIIPANESMGGVVVNFTQPVFFDREDQMNRFVDMISKGIDRKQRLRFGGAYSGG